MEKNAEHQSNLRKKLLSLTPRHSIWDIFRDFVAMGAIAFANRLPTPESEEREKEYLRIAKKYTKEELNIFAECLGSLVLCYEGDAAGDVLGELYMGLEIGNKWTGQFFTPMSICRMMAQMHTDHIISLLKEKEHITVSEPSCGGGAMVIALAESLRKANVNYQKKIHVTAQDIDIVSVHMAYIQFTLLGIPAIIIHGDTLAMECRSMWGTLEHFRGGWSQKLLNDKKPRQRIPLTAFEETQNA